MVFMKSTADLVRALVICAMMLGLIAHPTRPLHGGKCNGTALANLLRSLTHESLTLYRKENQVAPCNEIFPELHVPSDSPLPDQVCPNVTGGLQFMRAALEIIMIQQNDLNPNASKLNDILTVLTERVKHLLLCVSRKVCPGATATPKPPNPPKHTYAKKQWGRTVLKHSEKFLAWLTKWLDVQDILERSPTEM